MDPFCIINNYTKISFRKNIDTWLKEGGESATKMRQDDGFEDSFYKINLLSESLVENLINWNSNWKVSLEPS